MTHTLFWIFIGCFISFLCFLAIGTVTIRDEKLPPKTSDWIAWITGMWAIQTFLFFWATILSVAFHQ